VELAVWVRGMRAGTQEHPTCRQLELEAARTYVGALSYRQRARVVFFATLLS